MQALKLPGIRGLYWLLEGYTLFRRYPGVIGFMSISYWLLLSILLALPYIGSLIIPVVMPGIAVGIMAACRNLESGLPAPFTLLVQALRDTPRSFIWLGLIYTLCSVGILAASTLVDGGTLLALLSGKEFTDAELAASSIGSAMILVLVLLIPLLMAYWFAPVLVAWHAISPVKALFFSMIACLRNGYSLFLYALCFIGIVGIAPGLLVSVLSAILPGMGSVVTTVIMLLMLTIVSPSIFASFYISYRDVFVMPESISEHV